MAVKSYKQLIVWQKALELVVAIYKLTDKFPSEENFNLKIQLSKAAVSIVSCIAEGSSRRTRKDFLHFLGMSFASGVEVETQIEVAKRLPKTKNLDYHEVDSLLEEVMKMLNTMIGNLSSRH